MKNHYVRKSGPNCNAAFGLLLGSLVLLIGGLAIASSSNSVSLAGVVLVSFAGTFLAALGVWTSAKGYSPMLGVGLGLLGGLPGLLIVPFLSDNRRHRRAARSRTPIMAGFCDDRGLSFINDPRSNAGRSSGAQEWWAE